MHTWLPDAHSEAPAPISALMSGVLIAVGLYAVLRVKVVVDAAVGPAFAADLLLAFGLLSMVVAAASLWAPRNYKRMLAYSSVEHMGILSLGAALGGAGLAAALFHVWSNGLTKAALFLSAGNLRRAAGSASMDQVRGLAGVTPRSAALFVAGMFAVTALPPFAPFFSELQVVQAGLLAGRGAAVAVFLCCLLLAFLGMTRVVFGVVDGRPPPAVRQQAGRFAETAGVLAPPLVLLGLSLALGLFTPGLLRTAWAAAATQILSVP
jgi:hydrogenase-4 component F